MLSSTQAIRFLLDENVRAELKKFLRSREFDLKLAVKGSSDQVLARLSKKEQRVLVTNDADFAMMAVSKVFGVIWLRLPQNNPAMLMAGFETVLVECKGFRGRIIILEASGWSSLPLAREIKI